MGSDRVCPKTEGLRDTVQPTSNIDSDPRLSGVHHRLHTRLQTNVPPRGAVRVLRDDAASMSNAKQTPTIADTTSACTTSTTGGASAARSSLGRDTRGAPRRLEVLLCGIPTAMPPLPDSRIRRGAGLPGAIHSRCIGLLWNLVAARGLGDLA